MKYTFSIYCNYSTINQVYVMYNNFIFVKYYLLFYLTDFNTSKYQSYLCPGSKPMQLLRSIMNLMGIRDLLNLFIVYLIGYY